MQARRIGVVLMQRKHPLAYFSKKLGLKNQNLSTYEKEFLALVTAVTKWRHYLMGGKFVIKTYHISLKYLLEQKLNTSSQHKGLSKLLGLDYVIEYKKGSENKVADALSRQEGETCNFDAGLMAISELKPQWVEEVLNSYLEDEWIKRLKEQIHSSSDNI
ncbi:hypothetical protein FCM35_KLT22338 [Carex littledalei]|uniref:Reverse transcriptase RNase H-like domain-containing protein n=1 Tax=Carex littledalei TaxID=544730 RepID=A0A833QCF4_9POAL|nr:hypothetical protein FCM35_KLT22338 [Carex littledalei]